MRSIFIVMAVFAPCLSASAAPAEPTAIVTKTGIEMVFLPGGTFAMGDAAGEADETPHEVSVSPFYIDRFEVSQEEYQRLMDANPSKIKNPKNPVEQIRWSDAVRYCNERSKREGLEPAYDLKAWRCNFDANGYRLPTEAEWEYAARAGTSDPYFFGGADANLKQFGWFKDNASGKPRPVKQRKPNPWGLYDTAGNVWEWCNDFYKVDYYGESPKQDPRGPDSGNKKVLRGGCWATGPETCRSAYRYNENPAYADACFGYDIYGFRCVRPYRGEPVE